ncbi:MAG: hypothetical protein ACI80V_001203 [Rhodothermales bacterium]|jgi:hypothetical protein
MTDRTISGLSKVASTTLALLWLLAMTNTSAAQSLVFSSGGGPLTLTLTTASAGSNPTDASDASTELTWDGDFGVTAKISVSTCCPSQSFGLNVELTVTSWGSGTVGTEQGEKALTDGMADADLFNGIPTTRPGRLGVGTLTYRATATAAQGTSAENGDDNHTVSFTVLAQ